MTAMVSKGWRERDVAAHSASASANEPRSTRPPHAFHLLATDPKAEPGPQAIITTAAWDATPHRTVPQGASSWWYEAFGKRTLDVFLAVLLLIVFSPLMLVIACWIIRDSPGRAIYSQQRVGRGQRLFTIYKFRTMAVHAQVMLKADPELEAQYATHWKIVRDPRVTRCGAFLRRLSLDELPQLINVLKGEMSIVGPRPYLPHELNDEFGAHAPLITSVLPGITGLWQVSGRSELGPRERIRLDEAYVRTSTGALDLRILARTFKAVVKSYGAY